MSEGLIDRIEQGMTTAMDAEIVARAMAKLARYEVALTEIAIYGRAEDAMKACQALAECARPRPLSV
ncbi:hypothetical protein EDC61_11944 [Sulfuritortus calidifontis]|uniref:Uncharacterized protein n=1 Tax=Sulfuritortus calidifontis TaxID=1914471 RepID=A0A4R3JRM6_9PROT|nr:hypothetical protein [Sulfuritortus calidifontis]TCS69744.1 hypothetical protein EDC61_11944 [Sulfuritortus calidifontis]